MTNFISQKINWPNAKQQK